jgi:hypothetical protein
LDKEIAKKQIKDMLDTSEAKLTTWLTSTFRKNLRIQTMRAKVIANAAADQAYAILNRRKAQIDSSGAMLESSSGHVKKVQERQMKALEQKVKDSADNFAIRATHVG